jgi:spore coat protein A
MVPCERLPVAPNAGLAAFYLLRDKAEERMPLPKGPFEIPIVIQDRTFNPDASLFYPAEWVPEFFGNTILANGKVWPFLEVGPRRYRFRILNGSNARFYRLRFEPDLPFHVIGVDGGLLERPVTVNEILLAPAERVDVISIRTRDLTLNERTEQHCGAERLIVLLGTRNLTGRPQPYGWGDSPTENPVLGTVEIWRLIYVTVDTHPIHLHLVRFQILDRRPFDVERLVTTGELVFTGPPVPPEPYERGFKDTVRANPGEVTRVIARFGDFFGPYVWHCHILEHEDNEMMRRMQVVRPGCLAFEPAASCAPDGCPPHDDHGESGFSSDAGDFPDLSDDLSAGDSTGE